MTKTGEDAKLMTKGLRLLLMCFAICASSFAAAESGVLGYWSTPNQSTVHVYQCASGVCAQLVHLSSKVTETTDAKNPDAALRKKPLCGLEIGHGFQLADTDHAKDGTLYDPESGKTYRGMMTAQGDELKLRGYVGISLFGRTEVWHRTKAAHGCGP